MSQSLSLTQVTQSGEAWQLSFARPGDFVFPTVDGLPGHADKLAVIRGGEAQPLSLGAQALGREPHVVGLGWDGRRRSALQHLLLKRVDFAPQLEEPAFHLGNFLAVLAEALRRACVCLRTSLRARREISSLSTIAMFGMSFS